jgi:hypothetical protein
MSNKTNFNQEIIIIFQHVITSIIGTIGNLLVLMVYKRKLKDNNTITFFIVHLAITDLICCLFLIPINCYHELNIGKIESDFMCKFHSFLNILNITYSCFLMTLVAFERFFSITFPFKKIVTKSRAKFIMSILFISCLIIGLLGGLSIGIYHKVLSVRTLNGTEIKHIDLYNETFSKHSDKNKIELRRLPDSIGTYFKDANPFPSVNRVNDSFLNDLIIKTLLVFDSNQNTLHNSSVIEIEFNKTTQPKPVFSRILYKNITVSISIDIYEIDNNEKNAVKDETGYYYKLNIVHESILSIRVKNNHINRDQIIETKLRPFQSRVVNKRSLELNMDDMQYIWMPTNHCFPNNRIISIDHFSYLRVAQNLIVVVCFTIIFILYAFICINVSKRRQLKMDRDKYYKKILTQSKKNTHLSHNKSEQTMSHHSSCANTVTSQGNKNGQTNLSSHQTHYDKITTCINSNFEIPIKYPTLEILASDTQSNFRISKSNFDSENTFNGSDHSRNDDVEVELVDTPHYEPKEYFKTYYNQESNAIVLNIQEKPDIVSRLNPEEAVIPAETSENKYNENKSTQTVNSSIGRIKYKKNKKLKEGAKQEKRNFQNKMTDSQNQNDIITSAYTTAQTNYRSVLLGNLKTAFMLFVVTIIMILVFTPALLTSLGIISYNPIHWNLIYINNAVNPVVYSFLNTNFRKSLKNNFNRCNNRFGTNSHY